MVKLLKTPSKLHSTDRFRGGIQFVETWTNAKAGFIGFLTGRGYSSEAIAEDLSDGTSAPTIRRMWRLWGLPDRDEAFLTIPMTVRQRSNLADRAAQHGISTEEYCRRMLICGSMPKDRYQDVVPEDQF